MVRRLAIVLGLVGMSVLAAGCSFGSRALGSFGGCDTCGSSIGSQARTYSRTWARGMQHQQEFIDTYFLNYDVNDPYRCECPIYDYCDTCGNCVCK